MKNCPKSQNTLHLIVTHNMNMIYKNKKHCYCIALHCMVLCCVVLYYIVLHSTMHSTACTVLNCSVLLDIVLDKAMLLYNVVLIFHSLSTLSCFSCFNFLTSQSSIIILDKSSYGGKSKRVTQTPPGFFNLHILGRTF